jgi:putative sigma-54 modulation protein
MNVKIQAVGFKADQKLQDFTIGKIEKLEQFFDNLIGAEVFFRLENTQDDENKMVEIKLEVPGNDLFAKKQAKSFEEATDLTVEALRRQIDKLKGKQNDKN